MRILIIRAEPGASQTAERLVGRGCEVITSPVLQMEWIAPETDVNIASSEGLIFTSANGVRSFVRLSGRRDLPAWCVGEASAAAARAAGFANIQDAGGASDDLMRLIEETAPAGMRLLHVGNEAEAGELAGRLRQAGFAARFAALYRMRPAQALGEEARAAILSKRRLCVLIHSARGAAAFANLVSGLDLGAVCGIAISAQAAAPLAGAGLQNIAIAERPNEQAMLDVLERGEFTL